MFSPFSLKTVSRRLLLAVSVFFSSALLADTTTSTLPDTLKLSDGSVLFGKLLSANSGQIKFESERVESKQQAQRISLGRIQDADIATEYTNLAKNLITQDATSKAMIHSRVSAENVFNLLI